VEANNRSMVESLTLNTRKIVECNLDSSPVCINEGTPPQGNVRIALEYFELLLQGDKQA
jgi:hypothetical protein